MPTHIAMQIRFILAAHGVSLAENENVERIDNLNVKVKTKLTRQSAIEKDVFGGVSMVSGGLFLQKGNKVTR